MADKIGIPLATGERFATKWAFTELLARNLVDIVQSETTRLGGITELKKLAAMAEAQSVSVAPHAMPEEHGKIKIPTAPGLGVDIDEKAAAAHPIADGGAYRYSHRTPEEIQRSFVR